MEDTNLIILFIDKYNSRSPLAFMAKGDPEKIGNSAAWIGREGWNGYMFFLLPAETNALPLFQATPLRFYGKCKDFSSWEDLLEQSFEKARAGGEEEAYWRKLHKEVTLGPGI